MSSDLGSITAWVSRKFVACWLGQIARRDRSQHFFRRPLLPESPTRSCSKTDLHCQAVAHSLPHEWRHWNLVQLSKRLMEFNNVNNQELIQHEKIYYLVIKSRLKNSLCIQKFTMYCEICKGRIESFAIYFLPTRSCLKTDLQLLMVFRTSYATKIWFNYQKD